MKYFIGLLSVVCIGCIIFGFIANSVYSQKFIGFGVVGLFIIVFPLFSYHRWKNKNLKDYMINKENLDKMRNHKKKH
jgi:membrane protein YdbS with pleckstrin-like domain